ncbi:hypothetical protein FJZ23_01975 [Candidatus Parcubacteria bacterium]|nr:hypothetical protein [Candidatus Parcubacteria bacterium]
MKYFLLLPALALLGAGCAAAPSVKTEPPAPVSAEYPAPDADDVEEMPASGTETTVTVDDGTEITFETKPAEDEDVEIDDGVPVTNIVLGGATLKLDMVSENFSFAPKVIEAKAGENIRIMFTKNTGFHTFVIDEINLKFPIKAGEALEFKAPTTPGEYTFYCDIGSHRAFGMQGKLIVK